MENDLNKIQINNLSKSFLIGRTQRDNALSHTINSIFKKNEKSKFEVLKNISFELKKGESLGIIGGNGSGKSTLLRVIAKIYQKDSGEIKTTGNIIYINGHGIGLKQRLSMKDNIYLLASILGLNKKEIKERFNEIVAFSELKDFLNTKVYKFSYGMMNRLCFSIIIHSINEKNSDILLLDEVFGSGGDLNFQKKAINKTKKLLDSGYSAILVSHDLGIIEKYCDRAILLEDGEIKESGNVSEVISKYKQKS